MTELDPPVVATASGRVRGRWRAEPGGVASAAFLGIPFAQAPVGELRYAAPVPPEPWEGVRDAQEYGPTPKRGEDPAPTLIPEPAIPGEATLNVNVFTPAPGQADAALPVLVWIHGGGYIEGSPASPWYDGASFTRDGVVTVSLSYRLGFDGFGHIPGAPANRGVRDWIAGLEWVRDNIRAFGGDPSRVTIGGQSAGGGAVLTLLALPEAQELFEAAWAVSPALADVDPERARTLTAKLAALAGVPATRAGFSSVDEQTLIDLQSAATEPPSGNGLEHLRSVIAHGPSWGPMIDGELLRRPTVESLASGIGADKPLLIGSADDEFTMLVTGAHKALRLVPAGVGLRLLGVSAEVSRAYRAANRAQRAKGSPALLGRYITDAVFRSLVLRVAESRATASAPTWSYRFAWAAPMNGWAHHCLDVPFWFDCLAEAGVARIAGDHPPQALADALHGSAAAFVRSGEPGWPAWSPASGATRVFGGDPSSPDVERDGYRSVRALV